MTSRIIKPEQKTYFILIDTYTHYGEVNTDQYMKSGLNNLEIFLVYQEWIDRLLELGIDFNYNN